MPSPCCAGWNRLGIIEIFVVGDFGKVTVIGLVYRALSSVRRFGGFGIRNFKRFDL